MLSTASLLWSDETQLSVSFAPDGTSISGRPSSLFETLDAAFDRRTWQETILRAFQTWSNHTNIDFGLVSDAGQPFGVSGPRSDDSRFGDVRIGAAPLASDVAAISVSDKGALSGTWVGDVIFNSKTQFTDPGDLYSVALHEIGHVLGLQHNDRPGSVMGQHGSFATRQLDSLDIAAVDELHGQRRPDDFELAGSNDSPNLATEIRPVERGPRLGTTPILVYAQLSTTDDLDYFRLSGKLDLPGAETYRGPLTIRLQASQVSLVSLQLTVSDNSGLELVRTESSVPGGSSLIARIEHLDPDVDYVIGVQASGGTAFRIGGYTLVVTYDDLLQVEPQAIDRMIVSRERDLTADEISRWFEDDKSFLNQDFGSDDSWNKATPLGRKPEFDFESHFEATGSISTQFDRDYYRFDAPNDISGDSYVNVFVRSLDEGRLVPHVDVRGRHGQPIEVTILSSGGGEVILQAPVDRNERYHVMVAASERHPLFSMGNYRVNLSFSEQPIQPTPFVANAIDSRATAKAISFHVARTQLFHFVLHASGQSDSSQALLVRILDEAKNVVHQFSTFLGETRSSGGVLLAAGSYLVLFSREDLADTVSVQQAVSFELLGDSISDPFAIEPEDPTEDPVFACPDNDEVFCYPGGIESGDPFLWEDFLDSLPEIPDLGTDELISSLIGDWWSWYWQQQSTNGPVLGQPDTYSARSGQWLDVLPTVGVLANDVDPEAAPFIAILDSDVSSGTLHLRPDGGFQYRSTPGFIGSDRFSYIAHDFIGNSVAVTVQIEVVAPIGDFNGDLLVTPLDVDLLCNGIENRDSAFDLDGDGRARTSDVDFLIRDIMRTVPGDANLDGIFDSSDLILVFQAGLYEVNDAAAGWGSGDWNCDGRFSSSDLIVAFQSNGYSG
jgi:hypothetical protein